MARVSSLTNEEKAATGFTHRVDFSYLDIPAGIPVNTPQVFAGAGSPAGWVGLPSFKASDIVRRVELHLTVPLQNTADAAFNTTTLSLGDAGLATRYISASETNLNGTEVIDVIPGAATNFINTAAAQLQLTLNSMAAKTLSSLNKGQFYILFDLVRAADQSISKAAPFGSGYTP